MEPLAALVAVLAVAFGLTLYAGTVAETSPTPDREPARAVLDAVLADGETLGVVDPTDLEIPETGAGVSVNFTLETNTGRWTRGTVPSPTADRSSGRVSVRTNPGTIEPGRLRVAVW